jgi:hypothetical protein
MVVCGRKRMKENMGQRGTVDEVQVGETLIVRKSQEERTGKYKREE